MRDVDVARVSTVVPNPIQQPTVGLSTPAQVRLGFTPLAERPSSASAAAVSPRSGRSERQCGDSPACGPGQHDSLKCKLADIGATQTSFDSSVRLYILVAGRIALVYAHSWLYSEEDSPDDGPKLCFLLRTPSAVTQSEKNRVKAVCKKPQFGGAVTGEYWGRTGRQQKLNSWNSWRV